MRTKRVIDVSVCFTYLEVMKKADTILGTIIEVTDRLRPLGYLLSHFRSVGEGEIDEKVLQNLGALIEEEVRSLESVSKDLDEVWERFL